MSNKDEDIKNINASIGEMIIHQGQFDELLLIFLSICREVDLNTLLTEMLERYPTTGKLLHELDKIIDENKENLGKRYSILKSFVKNMKNTNKKRNDIVHSSSLYKISNEQRIVIEARNIKIVPNLKKDISVDVISSISQEFNSGIKQIIEFMVGKF